MAQWREVGSKTLRVDVKQSPPTPPGPGQQPDYAGVFRIIAPLAAILLAMDYLGTQEVK